MLLRIRVSPKLSAWCAAAVFGFAGMMASGQSTTQGAIAGTVEDVTSAVIPGATITIHNEGTNAEQHLTADSSGLLRRASVGAGHVYGDDFGCGVRRLQVELGDCAGRPA